MKINKTRIVAIEGFDGSGKTSIAKWIAEYLGYEYHKSPSEAFADVREKFDSVSIPMHERLAFYTGDCIRMSMMFEQNPDKKYVLDRYYYSTVAYHEAKQPGVTSPLTEIYKSLHKPDVVFLIISDFETIIHRIKSRNENALNDDLFLTKKLVNKIYSNFKKIIDVNCVLIHNNEDFETAINQIKKSL